MAWVFLIIGIVFEVLGTTFLKLSDGFTNLVPSILMFVFWGAGFGFLSFALRKIDISIAYAIWSGSGIAFMAVFGIYWFGEIASTLKLVSIGFIILGVVGLNFAADSHSTPTVPESKEIPEEKVVSE
jgi:small multidrug resistance pump